MRVHNVLPSVATSAMLGLSCAMAHATEVTIVSSHGNVSVTQGNNLMPVSVSTHLTLPAQIKTGSDGTLDLKDNESIVHIGPNSTVALPDTGASGSLVDRYLQSAGSALYNIQSRHGRPMSVETPYLVSVVKGTVFTVSVEDGATSVTLLEGSLDVSAPGVHEHVLLKANQSIRHSPGDRSLVVSPAGAVPRNMKNSGEETAGPVNDGANANQVALVNRDLADVGATVSVQHALLSASVTRSPAVATVANSSTTPTGSKVSGSSTAPAAANNGTSTGTTPAAPGPAPSTTPATASSSPGTSSSVGTTPATSGPAPSTPPATAGSSPGTSSSPGTTPATSGPAPSTPPATAGSSAGSATSTTPGATGTSATGTSATGTSGAGANNGLAGLIDGLLAPVLGCNGKTDGTGNGRCLGHDKPKK